MNDNILTITELCNSIKTMIPNKKFKVSGNVNQLKNSHGHIFFTFKDSESCISCSIWKHKVEQLKKNQNFKINEGDIINIEGKLDFYSNAGKLNFIVEDIISNEGEGELISQYNTMKEDFQNKGYFNKEHKKKLNNTIKNILLLTSESGAAYHDFMYCIENAKSKVNIELRDVIVQGINCPSNICEILREIQKSDKQYDLVVITRGGGSFQDLFGFSQPELITTLYNFNLPTMSAIGHMIDNPLSDLVASYNQPTPSLAAQFIVDYNLNYIRGLTKISNDINNIVQQSIKPLISQLNIYNKLERRLFDILNDFEKENKEKFLLELNNNLNKLNQMETKLKIPSNIILNGGGKILNHNDFKNYKGNIMEIVWNNVVMKVNVMSITNIE